MFASKPLPLQAQPNGAIASTSSAHLVAKHAIRSSGRFPHRLSFYDAPPTEEITTDEFESWAIDRLRGASPS
jgi:DNA primase large subunit